VENEPRSREFAVKLDLFRVRGERNEIAVLRYEPKRARDVWIVAGHGYSSSKQNLDFLCYFLASHGYGALSLDFPGHKLGASGGRLESVDDLLDAMGSVIAHARETQPGPLYAMGHSMGAMTALFTAARDPGIAGTIAITTGFGRPSALDALREKGVTDFRAAYVHGLPLPELVRGVDEMFQQALPKLAGRPQLYIAAERDAMVSRKSVEELYNRAHEPKTFVTIASDHTSAAENARGEVLQWLNKLHPR
jgi:alpha-beta hydrolase superfamily lysophospholipase